MCIKNTQPPTALLFPEVLFFVVIDAMQNQIAVV